MSGRLVNEMKTSKSHGGVCRRVCVRVVLVVCAGGVGGGGACAGGVGGRLRVCAGGGVGGGVRAGGVGGADVCTILYALA